MRNKILVMSLLVSNMLFSQKQDYIWVIGQDYNYLDSGTDRLIIDFNYAPPKIKKDVVADSMNMFVTNACFSDSTGKLLFYSNGCDIADANGNILPNGEGLNPGHFHNRLCDEFGRGYSAGFSSAILLTLPEHDSLFYMFHTRLNYIPPPNEDAYVDKLQYTVVKVSNMGSSVLIKNEPIMSGALAFGEMNAVKHANGEDWWLIVPKRNSNQFYSLLFTKDGVVDTLTQTIGDIPPASQEGYGQTFFSSDGTRMIRYYPHTPIMHYIFNRNTGLFTEYSTFQIDVGNTLALEGGGAFSPSGQFLYISALTNVYQFDLTVQDISSSQTTVATWDGFVDPIATSFLNCQLGPDCKIYMVAGGDLRYYHIIHNPDEPGLACNVEQRGMVFPIPSGASIPYFPNYRLGPIDNPGLPCSPVVATGQPALPMPGISAWPNPAGRQLSFGPLPPEAKALRLYDVYGRVAKELSLTGGNEVYTLSVEDLAAGLYFWEVSGTRGHASGKVDVIMR